ncbi:ABC transporter substrate-binding protein [Couchioplanes azureus]|uniref:ABC transporter substrate-binding protein n=1 Tax=Couchioplanes caeruleus TaxID=56438 RepID=UPI00166FB676|nr:ABC transporter substrate-binding protein [Couchioplanes caeruleus]GGQ70863.1 ABC transporter substrate-binding protein [Couchioplanes caeruleus subsp. azureus]
MRRLMTAAIAVTALLLGGCGGGGTNETASPAASASGAAFPVTAGGVTLDKRPERIVSLSPTATEMLFAIDAGKQVTAVDDQSNYPAEAPRSDLSGFKPNAEAIAAKNPDLVVLSDDLNKIVEQLTRLKIPVLRTPAAKTLQDSYTQIGQLGALTGHPAEAAALVERMRGQIDKIVKGVPARSAPLTYYYELDPTYYTVTSETYVGSIFALFGLKNVADGAKTAYPQLAQEALIAADPDMIFLADSKCCAQSPETVARRKGWAGVTAVKNKQIVALNDDVASRWGPRVVDLVQAVADAVAKAPAA